MLGPKMVKLIPGIPTTNTLTKDSQNWTKNAKKWPKLAKNGQQWPTMFIFGSPNGQNYPVNLNSKYADQECPKITKITIFGFQNGKNSLIMID